MKIAHKIIALIVLAAIAITLLTSIAYYKSSHVKEDAAALTTHVVPSLMAMTDLQRAFAQARYAVLFHIIQNDAAAKQKVREQFGSYVKLLDESLIKFETSASSEEDKKNIANLIKEIDLWRPLAAAVLKASDAQDSNLANQLIREQCAPQSVKVYEAMAAAEQSKSEISDLAGKKINTDIQSSTNSSVFFGLILLIAIAITGWLMSRSIMQPLNALRQFVVQLSSDYDFTRRMSVTHHDEIGESLDAMNGLINTLQISLQQLNRIGRDVTNTAVGLSSASGELSKTSQSVSNAASSMASGVEEVTVSISHVADRADECDRTAREAGQMASTGGAVIETTITSINQIADDVRVSAQQIESLKERTASINAVVNVIKDIADQTNLLALNAAIEAARAGDLGRGFAVVADEVRKLAERTASSTQEIIATVSAIQNEANATVSTMQHTVRQVDLGVERAQEASDAIAKIRHNADQVVEQVSEITGSMREQSAASAMMAQQVEQVAQMSEESSSVAQNTASEGERLRQLSQELDSAISRYRV